MGTLLNAEKEEDGPQNCPNSLCYVMVTVEKWRRNKDQMDEPAAVEG